MQFLYSLFLITTLFTSLQAMEAEVVGHAAQEAEEAAASEKAKKAIIPEQSLISTYLPFFDNTIFNGLPTEIKNQIIQKLSKANTIEQVETKLYDLSNQYNYLGKYIKTPEFTSRWLQLVRQIGAEETKKASDARDLLRAQQKAAARVKPRQEIKEVTVPAQETLTAEQTGALAQQAQLQKAAEEIKSAYLPHQPTSIAEIAEELQQHILEQLLEPVIADGSLEEINLQIVRARRTNKTFNRILNGKTFTEKLIAKIAQRPVRDFSEESDYQFFAEQASLIAAAATINTPTAIEWLKNYLNLSTRKKIGHHVLIEAISSSNNGMIDSLLKAGVSPKEIPINKNQAKNIHPTIIKRLLTQGAYFIEQ